MSQITHVNWFERKVEGRVMEIVTWYTKSQRAYSVDWRKNNFSRTGSAPLLSQFSTLKKPSLKLGLLLVCQLASTMKHRVELRQFFFGLDSTLFASLWKLCFIRLISTPSVAFVAEKLHVPMRSPSWALSTKPTVSSVFGFRDFLDRSS